MRFTDSPYEQMMQQIPAGRETALGPPALPPEHPCYGCPYGRNAPCIGTCYRNLVKRYDSGESAHQIKKNDT